MLNTKILDPTSLNKRQLRVSSSGNKPSSKIEQPLIPQVQCYVCWIWPKQTAILHSQPNIPPCKSLKWNVDLQSKGWRICVQSPPPVDAKATWRFTCWKWSHALDVVCHQFIPKADWCFLITSYLKNGSIPRTSGIFLDISRPKNLAIRILLIQRFILWGRWRPKWPSPTSSFAWNLKRIWWKDGMKQSESTSH